MPSGVRTPVHLGLGEDILDHQHVDVDERGLADGQGEHPEFLLVAAAGGRELAARLAIEDHAVVAIPRLDQVEALLDLALSPVA